MSVNQSSEVLPGPITAPQRRALFAFAKAHDLETDDLRAMTPAGSISCLSRAEASELLNRLNAGSDYEHPRHKPRGRRRPKGVYRIVTDKQLGLIEKLRIQLGWTREKLVEWLGKRTHKDGGPLTRLHSTADAVTVIELLKEVLRRQEAAQARRGRSRAVREAEN